MCNLTTTGLVALQIILMETVEYLVVGKHTYALLMVNKPLMNRLLNSSKFNVVTPIFEYRLDTLRLLLTVTADKQTIAILHILLQTLAQQVEILVEDRLHIRFKHQ